MNVDRTLSKLFVGVQRPMLKNLGLFGRVPLEVINEFFNHEIESVNMIQHDIANNDRY